MAHGGRVTTPTTPNGVDGPAPAGVSPTTAMDRIGGPEVTATTTARGGHCHPAATDRIGCAACTPAASACHG